ncbi:MAG: hypothetical protein Pg6B_09480 [Candidatus Azobacteroides pseudotrichonymphae]|nr:MAG: hypothetical protein Pg6B_09480 [Candidatus Azobacteroides pseudotrichonymphae]
MKKPLFLFYSLMLLLVTVSVSSCKNGLGSNCTEHCTIYFKDGTKKEFDIDSKYQLNCGLENCDEYPGIFHICLNYIYSSSQKLSGEWKNGGDDYFRTGDRCCVIDKKNVTEEGCLKEMEKVAKKIGDCEIKKHHHYGYITLSVCSSKNVTGYSYRFKNHEKTIRLFK